MKKAFAVALMIVAAVAWAAGRPRSYSVTNPAGGYTPNGVTAGVSLDEASVLRVRVIGNGGTLTGGKVCAYYLPTDGGATGWVHNPLLDLTLSANVEADGGIPTKQQLPDLEVGGKYGRSAFVPCGLTGTATTFTVTTESWGPSFP